LGHGQVGGLVSVYVSFSDESSVANGAGQFIISGLVANELYWPTFSGRWADEVLQPPPTIEYLHMADIRSRKWREERGITDKNCASEKVQKAIQVITEEAPTKTFMGSLPEARFSELKKRVEAEGFPVKKRHGFADYPCFVTYAAAVLNQVATDTPDLEKINFVVSRKKYVSHYLQANLREDMIQYFRRSNPSLAKFIGDIVPLSMEQHPPLQAADVICWHLNRAYALTLDEEAKANALKLNEKGIVGLEMNESMLSEIEASLIQEIREKRI
jgi:hypothetical protein